MTWHPWYFWRIESMSLCWMTLFGPSQLRGKGFLAPRRNFRTLCLDNHFYGQGDQGEAPWWLSRYQKGECVWKLLTPKIYDRRSLEYLNMTSRLLSIKRCPGFEPVVKKVFHWTFQRCNMLLPLSPLFCRPGDYHYFVKFEWLFFGQGYDLLSQERGKWPPTW